LSHDPILICLELVVQTLKSSELLHRGQTLPDLGEVRADSLDEGVFVTTLAELAQKVTW
jgi:hypothetical protein